MVNIMKVSKKLLDYSVRRRKIEDDFFNYIKNSISQREYDFWFSTLVIEHIDFDKHIIFGVNSSLHKEWMIINYGDLLYEAIKEITGAEYSMQFEVYD
jgi:chromosomal replication initiation ATPase DnaA